MSRSRLKVIVLALLVVSCRRGCREEPPPPSCCVPLPTCTSSGGGSPTPTPGGTETRTPFPTRTPEPTDTRTPFPTRTKTDAPAPTETPAPTATVAPTSTPTPRQTPVLIDPVPCEHTSSQGIYKHVKDAILKYKSDHPDYFVPGTEQLPPARWDAYYFEVVDNLNKGGFVEAVVDACGGAGICGEIAGKLWGTPRGSGFHEQYHILTSEGFLRYQSDSYRATCTPAGFGEPTPGPTPSPTSAPPPPPMERENPATLIVGLLVAFVLGVLVTVAYLGRRK